MAENSKIEWTDHTFNPWEGCTKVSEACKHCYAETLVDHRYGRVKWGKGQPRRRTGAENWKKPLRWNREAQGSFQQVVMRDGMIHRGCIPDIAKLNLPEGEIVAAGSVRPRVFSASLADWLDDEVPIEWLADFLRLVFETPHLDWLLLTKRPENFPKRALAAGLYLMGYRDGQTGSKPTVPAMLPEEQMETFLGWAQGEVAPANVWIGTTVENQKMADKRIPELLKIPAKVRFLSCEPLLGPVDLLTVFKWQQDDMARQPVYRPVNNGIHWVICGGESGPGARPMHPDWARSLRDQCVAADVSFFFKQWGEWLPQFESQSPIVTSGNPESLRVIGIEGLQGNLANGPYALMKKVGRNAAGRLLDGREWNEFPKVEATL